MDGVCCLPLTIFLLHQALGTSNVINVTGAVDRSITLVSRSTEGEAVAWSFQAGVIATVDLANPPKVQFFDTKYEPRLVFPNSSALTIPQLSMDDAGDYTAQNRRGKTIFSLRVHRELEVPTVTCVAQNCSAGGCSYLLHCAATSGSGFGEVSYSWKVGDRLESKEPVVLVEEQALDELQLFTCTTQNPISSRNVTVSAVAALCTENTTHPPPATGTSPRKQTAIVAVAMAGVVILSAVIISVIYCKPTGGRIFHLPVAKTTNTEDGEDYRTVYAQVGPSQQSFSNAQENPKKTPTPSEDTSKSIYSTVQALPQTDDEKMGNRTPGCQEQDEKSLYSSVSLPAQPCLTAHGPAVPMSLL
ncbi:SLAM family member 6-like isoform X2 [Colius striatus]|uniref:SLAM family member 6-like isoform X2 n=1 Tax=Colius striatus TaxID=57412 RepID=UPI002B1CE738|nr:SLAM family member 6-like isoform X2 [Colius striatus]